MTEEIKGIGVKLDDREYTGDYLLAGAGAITGNGIGITAVDSGTESIVLLSHADARKLAEFILQNTKEDEI